LVIDATGRVDYSEQLKQLANVMTEGRISIYPIDARGLTTPPGYSPDNAPTAGMGVSGDASSAGPSFHQAGSGGVGRAASGTAFGAREMASQMNLAGSHMSMSNLASATGGRALYNTNGLGAAIAKIQGIGENYYTLAYSPKIRNMTAISGRFRSR